MANKREATYHPLHMCAQTIPGPSWYDQNDPCEYEAVPGFDFCDRHLRDEVDWDETLDFLKEQNG